MFEIIEKYRPVFYGIFVVSAVGLVVTMFAGSQMGGGSFSGSATVAKVEGESISTQELIRGYQYRKQEMDDLIEKQLEGQTQNKDQMRQYLNSLMASRLSPESVLSEVIQQKFLLTTAQTLGMKSSPDIVREIIQNSPEFQREGRFDPLLYKERVARPGLYEKEISRRAILMRLGEIFNVSLSSQSSMEKQDEKWLNTAKNFAVLGVNLKNFQNPKSVSDSEVTAYLATPDAEAELKSYYDRNLSQFKKGEEVKARHILLTGDDSEKKASDIIAELKSKKITFEEAAKMHSADKSNAERGGDLGFFGKGVMDPAFEKASFSQNVGEVSEKPIKTNFGFHIVEVLEKKPAQEKSLETVKAEIAPKVLLQKRQSENAKAWIQKWVSSGQEPPEAELKSLSLKWSESLEWTPASERLGPVSQISSDSIGELMALSASQKLLKSTLTQGDTLYLVKWVDNSANKKAQELTPKAGEPKSEEAYRFYLTKRYERLEKTKKIYKSEKILAELNNAVQPQAEGR